MKQTTLKELAKEIVSNRDFVCFYARGMNDCKMCLTTKQSLENEEFGIFYLEKISSSFAGPVILYGNEYICESVSLATYDTIKEQEDIVFNCLYYYFYNENYMQSNIDKEEPIFFMSNDGECYDDYIEFRNIVVRCEHCAKCSTGLCSGETCDIDNHKVNPTKDYCLQFKQVEQDAYLSELWNELADVPMNPETKCIEIDFHIWKAGTFREDIWHWFDMLHSKGVTALMYNE